MSCTKIKPHIVDHEAQDSESCCSLNPAHHFRTGSNISQQPQPGCIILAVVLTTGLSCLVVTAKHSETKSCLTYLCVAHHHGLFEQVGMCLY